MSKGDGGGVPFGERVMAGTGLEAAIMAEEGKGRQRTTDA